MYIFTLFSVIKKVKFDIFLSPTTEFNYCIYIYWECKIYNYIENFRDKNFT